MKEQTGVYIGKNWKSHFLILNYGMTGILTPNPVAGDRFCSFSPHGQEFVSVSVLKSNVYFPK